MMHADSWTAAADASWFSSRRAAAAVAMYGATMHPATQRVNMSLRMDQVGETHRWVGVSNATVANAVAMPAAIRQPNGSPNTITPTTAFNA